MTNTYHKTNRQSEQDYYDDKAETYDGFEPVVIVRKRGFVSADNPGVGYEAYYKPLAHIFSVGLTQQEAIDELAAELQFEGQNPDILIDAPIRRYLG